MAEKESRKMSRSKSFSQQAEFASAVKVAIPQSTVNMQVATRVPDLQAGASLSVHLEGGEQLDAKTASTDKPEAALPESAILTGYDLTKVFGQGRLQYMALYIAVLGEFSLLCHNLLPTIVAADVDHWCKQPALYSNLTTEQWRNISIPRGADGKWLRCVRYEPPLLDLSTSRTTVPCHSWDYAPNAGPSVIAKWNLVCESHWLVTLSATLYMSGAMTAAALMGILSDELGRRPVICVSVLVLLISGVALCFTETYLIFVMLRFCVSASVSTIQITSFVLLFELSTPEYRCKYCVVSLIAALTSAPIFLRMVAQIARSWEMVQALIMLPTSLLTCAFYMTVESPNWVLTKRKLEDVEKAVMLAASTNGVKFTETVHHWRRVNKAWNYAEMETKITNKSGMGDRAGTQILLHRGSIVLWCWFLIILVYYGRRLVTRPSPLWLLVANVFLKVPVYCLYHSMISLGRRATLWGVLIGYSTLVASSILIAEFQLHPSLVALLDAAIDSFVDMATVLIFTFSVELFPTAVRSSGVFAGFFFGRIGGMAAPVFFEIGLFSADGIPSLTLSLVCLLTAMAVLSLPETMAHGTVNTIGDLDEMNRQRKLRRFSLLMKRSGHASSRSAATKHQRKNPAATSKSTL